MTAKRHYSWIGAAVGAALSITALPSCNSSDRANERQVGAAENEVYEVVVGDMVGDMVTSASRPSKLVFHDTLLTGLAPGADMKSCEESARKKLRLEKTTPPYNSLADRLYRFVNRSHDDDDSLRADTIRDFLTKLCTAGRLSLTLHTDLPKTFLAPGSAPIVFIAKDGPVPFELLFPGASEVISLSHVGFDSTLHEAIVLTSFVREGFWGSGHRYVLRKIRTHWEVVNKLLVWELVS